MRDEEEHVERTKPQNIVDPVIFGRRLRAQRILQGFDRMSDFTEKLRRQYGVEVSDRTVYAIERGEQLPHIDFYVAAVCALKVDRGYFLAAIRGDCATYMEGPRGERRHEA